MEPLKPSMREALKQEHEGLTDEVIDRAAEMLMERFSIDPEADPLRIQELDREREELMRKEVPEFEKVLQKARQRERQRK